MPFISVIMACHNAVPYVGEAIKSVICQTFTDLELIFVDDNSSDDSLAIANMYAQSDKRIKVYSSKISLGAGPARNLAIEKSTGEWLAVLDADDVFINEKLEKQVALIKSTKDELVMVGTGCFQIDAFGRRFAVYKYPLTSSALKNRLYLNKAFPPHSSLMYRAFAFRAIGGFNGFFLRAQDYELWLRLSTFGAFACVSEPLIEYRLHNTNISNKVGELGYSQLDYSVAAGVCHLLRLRGIVDPSAAGDTMLWDSFMRHVAEEIRASGELDYRRWKSSWRNQNQFKGGQIAKGFSVLQLLLSNPVYAWRLLKQHTVGSSIPKTCLDTWLKKSLCAA
jgi:glycosyltransferase involved in cell wall biosynthesis